MNASALPVADDESILQEGDLSPYLEIVPMDHVGVPEFYYIGGRQTLRLFRIVDDEDYVRQFELINYEDEVSLKEVHYEKIKDDSTGKYDWEVVDGSEAIAKGISIIPFVLFTADKLSLIHI